tara:strand:- start:622 stop:759 length:138 start_codon:yes stop_codon:yes gene_type:complete
MTYWKLLRGIENNLPLFIFSVPFLSLKRKRLSTISAESLGITGAC